MEPTTIEVDRTGWPAGPWDNEPDRIEWKTEAGLPAVIVRQPDHGGLCGYVAVAKGHPCYGLDYITEYEPGADGEPDYARPKPNPVDELRVHGGITYGNACAGRICHVPAPGEPDDVWWLGFDTHHHGDFVPGEGVTLRNIAARHGWTISHDMFASGEYRDVYYVRAECESLARQLAAMAALEQ